MSIAAIVAIVCALLAVAAMLYAMHVSDENDALRAAKAEYLQIISDLIEGEE